MRFTWLVSEDRTSEGWFQKIAEMRHDNRFSWSDRGRADTLHGYRFAVLGGVPEAAVGEGRFGVVSQYRNDKVSTMSGSQALTLWVVHLTWRSPRSSSPGVQLLQEILEGMEANSEVRTMRCRNTFWCCLGCVIPS